jgi:hypothetical protein
MFFLPMGMRELPHGGQSVPRPSGYVRLQDTWRQRANACKGVPIPEITWIPGRVWGCLSTFPLENIQKTMEITNFNR